MLDVLCILQRSRDVFLDRNVIGSLKNPRATFRILSLKYQNRVKATGGAAMGRNDALFDDLFHVSVTVDTRKARIHRSKSAYSLRVQT